MDIIKQLAQELSLYPTQVEAAVNLIDQGNTIPFIARYRKEVTGSLDDAVLRSLNERLSYLRSLEKRKEEVLSAIGEQNKLTPQLATTLAEAETLAAVEDLYRPYKQKRKTRASVAKEKGLEPLAQTILAQNALIEPLTLSEEYINPEKALLTAQDALDGALDIIAETIADDPSIRRNLKRLISTQGFITAQGDDQENTTYTLYYDFVRPVSKMASHQILAIHRGEKEGILKTTLQLDEEKALDIISKEVITAHNPCAKAVLEAAKDSYKRLLFPSLERETFSALFEDASQQAIKVFAENLHHLLMQPPVKDRVVLGLDPAYRTGCKIAVVDGTGKVLDTAVIYPTPPQKRISEAKALLKTLITRHGVSVISIGNGTASRESELFIAEFIRELAIPLSYMVVSEAGASVYSASSLASEEFPQFDVSLRSAISIARRLQDPLAELVKIDPKAIGIGQYQHDMPPNRLDAALGGVVESCVNSVGVDLNTASCSLLSHVAGIGPAIAKNIVSYREEKGGFTSRRQLLNVPKLGKKAYEQCAGFLRIPGAANQLDATAVHPESYNAALALLKLFDYTPTDIGTPVLNTLPTKAHAIGWDKTAQAIGVGEPTIRDIVAELLRPGRDPRDELPAPILRTDIMEIKDLKPDMHLTGTVRNVLDFGAFVDIGVHQDGLVHISQLSDHFVRHPSEVVKVGDIVQVKILEVEQKRSRISLTMKGLS